MLCTVLGKSFDQGVASAVPATHGRNYSAELAGCEAILRRHYKLANQSGCPTIHNLSLTASTGRAKLYRMKSGKRIRLCFTCSSPPGRAIHVPAYSPGAHAVMRHSPLPGAWIAAAVFITFAVPVLLGRACMVSLFPRTERLSRGDCFGCAGLANRSAQLVPPLCWSDVVSGRGLPRYTAPRFPTAAGGRSRGHYFGVFVQNLIFTLLGLARLFTATDSKRICPPPMIGAVIGVLAIQPAISCQRLGMFRFIAA